LLGPIAKGAVVEESWIATTRKALGSRWYRMTDLGRPESYAIGTC
jgi:hypothetical protein